VPQGHLDLTCAVAELTPENSTHDLLAAADEILTTAKLQRSQGEPTGQVRGLRDRAAEA